MPRVNLGRAKPDPLKALISDYMRINGVLIQDIAQILDVSRPTAYTWFKAHSDTWRIQDVLTMARKLAIPIDDIRASIRF